MCGVWVDCWIPVSAAVSASSFMVEQYVSIMRQRWFDAGCLWEVFRCSCKGWCNAEAVLLFPHQRLELHASIATKLRVKELFFITYLLYSAPSIMFVLTRFGLVWFGLQLDLTLFNLIVYWYFGFGWIKYAGPDRLVSNVVGGFCSIHFGWVHCHSTPW